jgi:hypothetical protein
MRFALIRRGAIAERPSKMGTPFNGSESLSHGRQSGLVRGRNNWGLANG